MLIHERVIPMADVKQKDPFQPAEWEDVSEGEIVDLEQGVPIQGELQEWETIDVKGRKTRIYKMKTASGPIRFWGSAYLDRILTDSLVGKLIQLTYTGDVDLSDNRTMKHYGLKIAKTR